MKTKLIAWLLKQRAVQGWVLYAARPEAQRVEVKWTKEDAAALKGFLQTGTGEKLMTELENLKADADTNAVLRSTERSATALVGIARGVRVTVARLKQLTAVRQNPDNQDEPVTLPDGLEHLSDT